MSATRAFVGVVDFADPKQSTSQIAFPKVLASPIRPDLVRFVHTQLAKNARQPYAVSTNSGYQSSAESWGTGRAVARIPRVAGGGTHRAGQGAFGNQCRGGGMFAPTKVWRRWHRKCNVTERRHAVASALAAAAVTSLVMARGHQIDAVPEVPCVVSNEIEKVEKTKKAVAFLQRLGAAAELKRCKDSRTRRAGAGKRRNRVYKMRRGPLIVHTGEAEMKAFRNIPGIELSDVSRLNLLQLAPGGTMGRFIIYSKAAFETLSQIYGDGETTAPKKAGYALQRGMMTNTDLSRLINSNEIQSVLLPKKICREIVVKKPVNLLKNAEARDKVDPTFKTRKLGKKTTQH